MSKFSADMLSGPKFEASVRQVARQLYGEAALSGSVVIDGRERDEVINTGTEIIVVEATMLPKKDKTERDLLKSKNLISYFRSIPRFADYNFRILLVTANDPTADQNAVLANTKTGCPKEIISFSTLFSRLFDARHYLRIRDGHAFGSIRNPADETDIEVPPSSYIPTAMIEKDNGASYTAAELSTQYISTDRLVVFGDYGSGKSMTFRDIYLKERDNFIKGASNQCPVYLNLREHIAQDQPNEALLRHAQKIGFSNYASLISAWRTGFITLFLDGFDELTPPQFAGSVTSLSKARRSAVALVKRFFEETPNGSKIYVSGREHYFDDRQEAKSALGYGDTALILDLSGFNEDQIARFLKKKKAKLPTWLPTRPLLLGYLANSGFLTDDNYLSLNPTEGWDDLIDRICNREVNQIWGAEFEGYELRRLVEGLATRARQNSNSGRAVQDSEIALVYRTVFGRDADEPATLLARRLPGLGTVPGKTGSREFVDEDFFDAISAGDIRRYLNAPYGDNPLAGVKWSAGPLALQMASDAIPEKVKLSVALEQCAHQDGMSITASDIVNILVDRGEDYTSSPITLQKNDFNRMILDPLSNLSKITFQECVFNVIEFSRGDPDQERSCFPLFLNCLIERVEGATSSVDLPPTMQSGENSVENFAAYAGTNDAVISSSLPASVKVFLTVMRKLFMQRGAGRQYGALKRGLPAGLSKYVIPITDLIKSHGYAEDVLLNRRTILIPNRSKSADALRMINGPNSSQDPLLTAVKAL